MGKPNPPAQIAPGIGSYETPADEQQLQRQQSISHLGQVAAREYPDISLSFLMAWCVDIRNDYIGMDQVVRMLEQAQRAVVQSGKPDPPDQEMFDSLALLLLQNPRRSLWEAISQYASSVANQVSVGTAEEREAATDRLRHIAAAWLRNHGFYFSEKPVVKLPLKLICDALRQYSDEKSILIAPSIPRTVVQRVQTDCLISRQNKDTIAAIIDCTFFGTAGKAVAIGRRAIYWSTEGAPLFFPYSEIATIAFLQEPDGNSLRCGEFGLMSLGFGGPTLLTLLEILRAVQQLVVRHGFSTSRVAGLAAVPGMQALKDILLKEVVEPLARPERYGQYKVNIPNGILLYGPPGCGKTFVANALATELGHSFHVLSPADVASPYIHQSSLLIRQAFDEAAREAPSVLFFDEFEGLVPSRSELTGEFQFKAEEVNEFLVQIGQAAERRILLIAATNEPSKIDAAVLRTGRFDKKVYVGSPDLDARKEILGFYLAERPTDTALDLHGVAADLVGYASSDLKVLVDEAAKCAMSEGLPIGYPHIKRASERIPSSITADQLTKYREFGGEMCGSSEPLHASSETGVPALSKLPGMDSVKELLMNEIIAPLREPERYRRYGVGVPNGVLLYGPPGCGKTFAVRALAAELKFNFFEFSPGDLGSIYQHGTVLKITGAFKKALLNAPCVLFFDEIEGLVPARASLSGHEQSKAEEVNEFLLQLSNCSEKGVLVVAATNEPSKIDPAVQRTGRFDKKVYIGPPDIFARAQILDSYLKGRPLDDGLDTNAIAAMLEHYASSDIRVLVDEAAKIALREDARINIKHFAFARTRVPASITPDVESRYKSYNFGLTSPTNSQ